MQRPVLPSVLNTGQAEGIVLVLSSIELRAYGFGFAFSEAIGDKAAHGAFQLSRALPDFGTDRRGDGLLGKECAVFEEVGKGE